MKKNKFANAVNEADMELKLTETSMFYVDGFPKDTTHFPVFKEVQKELLKNRWILDEQDIDSVYFPAYLVCALIPCIRFTRIVYLNSLDVFDLRELFLGNDSSRYFSIVNDENSFVECLLKDYKTLFASLLVYLTHSLDNPFNADCPENEIEEIDS